VVSVEHGPTNATLKLILQHEFVGKHHWGIFLDKDFVGTLCHDPLANKLHVVALGLSSMKEIFIETDLPSLVCSIFWVIAPTSYNYFQEAPLTLGHIFRTNTALVEGDLCILFVDSSAKSWIFTVPRSCLLQSNDPYSPQNYTHTFKSNFAFFEGYCQNREDDNRETMTVTASSAFGVQAMTIHTPQTPNGDFNPVFTDIIFWVQPEDKNTPSPLVPMVLPNGIPGTLFSPSESNFWQPLFQTFSGRNGLIISDVEEEGKQILRLLSCDTRTVTYRDLPLPDFLLASRIHGLSIDDHLGVVNVIDSDGVLHAIPYA
jgi:hypothetical protein